MREGKRGCTSCKWFNAKVLGDGGSQNVCEYPIYTNTLPIWLCNLMADYERYLPKIYLNDVDCSTYTPKEEE